VAKAALRSAQNSVLGKGKRARGVTVTRSGQEELMRAVRRLLLCAKEFSQAQEVLFLQLFPSWQGNFDGSRPSLAGLDNECVIATLEAGLISEAELGALLHLIRSPDVRLRRLLISPANDFVGPFPQSPVFAIPFAHQYPVKVPS
jgi:hypothetical protein